MVKKLLFIAAIAAAPSIQGTYRFREIQNNIGITVVACETNELLVNTGGWKFKAVDFIKKGFKPIRVQIANHSDQKVSLSDYSAQLADSDIWVLTELLKCSENVHTLAYLITTQTICWAIIWLAVGGANLGLELKESTIFACSMYSGWSAFFASIGFFIGTPFYRMSVREANKKLHGIFKSALHAGHIIIPPHQSAEKIIFMPVGYQSIFSVEVLNESNGNTAAKFHIEIP